MRNATLITCNRAGVISSGMIWHDETDENEIVQLTIGEYKYDFNNKGEIVNTKGIQSCINLNAQGSCAQILQGMTCVPTCEPKFKSED
jgi:hypothetical protein